MPAGHEHVEPDASGFRGFVVEFYNIISDIVVQDGYQSVLNLKVVLTLIKARHARIKTCARETDGAGSYNSIFVALFTLQLHDLTGIKVTDHGHNEPGHGADICDTAGANCVRECWRNTNRTGLSIISAQRTTAALQEANMSGFIHRMVSHDPDRKIKLTKGKKFKGVALKTSQFKRYPTTGEFAGGVMFWRYYGHGPGIGFTKPQCEQMWGTLKLEDHMMTTVPVSNKGEGDAPASIPTTNHASSATTLRVGDSVRVWWEDAYFSAVIMDKDTTADGEHLCYYDDGSKLWHKLVTERWEWIAPTAERLGNLSVAQVKSRLREAGLALSGNKSALVNRLLESLLQGGAPQSEPNPITTNRVAVRASRPGIVERAKYGESHYSRMDRLPIEAGDIAKANEERAGHTQRWLALQERRVLESDTRARDLLMREARRQTGMDEDVVEPPPDPYSKPPRRPVDTSKKTMTGRDVVSLMHTHAETAYNVATWGDRRGNTQRERDGVNVYTFARADLEAWAHADSGYVEPDAPPPPQPEPDAADVGIGDRISVYWTEENQYFSGSVMKIKRSEGRVQVLYDDAVRLTHILGDEAWRREGATVRADPGPAAHARTPLPFLFEEGCVYGACRCGPVLTCVSVVGCPTARLLPARLRAVYDTSGWRCCASRDNGARLVFMRPPPECPLRGSSATQRRVQFGWTPEQLVWFDAATVGWSRKTIPFQSLVLDAERKWGHRAPYLEVMENRINGREGRERTRQRHEGHTDGSGEKPEGTEPRGDEGEETEGRTAEGEAALSALAVSALKARLSAAGLAVGGRKADLVARLVRRPTSSPDHTVRRPVRRPARRARVVARPVRRTVHWGETTEWDDASFEGSSEEESTSTSFSDQDF
jgi:hypothetical protein